MKQTVIIGILIKDRIKESGRTLNVLSKYASVISTRLGFHEVTDSVCSRVGVVILHLKGNLDKRNELLNELAGIGGIEVKKMCFEKDV